MAAEKEKHTATDTTKATDLPTCGIVMPIALTDGCEPSHWLEVLNIIKDTCKEAGFNASLVSDAADSGTILRRIVGNLYKSDIIIADVSGKNPNVMFELGMRLAFDKPAIVLKDDATGYSFDTGVIEHLGYPRDLHFFSILQFKEKLAEKLKGTLKASKDPEYTTFLKHFGEYTAKKIESTEVSSNEIILRNIEDIRAEISFIRKRTSVENRPVLFPNEVGITPEKFHYLCIELLPYIRNYIRENKVDDPFTDKSLISFLMSKNPRYAEISSPEIRQAVLHNALML